jgi:hypothetical protein
MQSTATLGHLLKYPDQKRNLTKILKRPMQQKETNHVESNEKTTAAKYHVHIKRNSVTAVLDSGVSVSIITNSLRKKLDLSIDRASNVVVITANGTRQRALGRIDNIPITIQTLLVPMNLQVIDSSKDTLLLRTDWFEKTQAQWNFGDRTLKLVYRGNETIIKTTHTHNTPMFIESDEENDEQDWEYEIEDDLEEIETYHSEVSDYLDDDPYDNP